MFYRKFCSNFIRKTAYNRTSARFQKHFIINAKEKVNRDVISIIVDNTQISSVKDWTDVRKAILDHEMNGGRCTNHNIDAMIVAHCTKVKRYDLGTSYITFLDQENIKPNLATVGKYLKLIYLKNYESCVDRCDTCPENVEKLILNLYEQLRKDYPVLDSFSLDNVTLALSLTSRWKECLDLLAETKITSTPSVSCYSAVAAASFLHNEEDLGWKLIREMLEREKEPQSVAFLAYIKSIQKHNKEEIIKRLETLFLLLHNYNLKSGEDVAVAISELGKKLGLRNSFTTVAYNGACKSCSQKLDSFELTDEEFKELKSKVFKNVIVGRDVFVRTTPEELERFKGFAENMGEFDVVLDGLNVAYSAGIKQSPQVFSALVAAVVSHFVRQGKRVLVLGRVHMKRWPHNNWSYVTQNARVFLAQNISQDDPYLLYCALSSGKNTIIVTRDLMRSHKFLLRDAKLKMLFDRWLAQRQYQLLRVDNKKGPVFRIPPPFDTVTQRNEGIWHIPFETDVPKDKNEFHRTWLCLKS